MLAILKRSKKIELYSESLKNYPDCKNWYLKITLGFADEKNKGKIIIPKVKLPIGYNPETWDLNVDYGEYGTHPYAELDTGLGHFEVFPGEDGMIAKTEFDHREMTKEEIEKELGYTIDIKGVCECPCENKE